MWKWAASAPFCLHISRWKPKGRNMFKQIALIATLSSALVAHAEIKNLVCEQTGPTEYRLTYQMTDDTHKVKIATSTDAAVKTGLQPVTETDKSDITVHAGKAGERMYFMLQPDHGAAREVSIRHISLDGTPNFRDLGGYETADGKFTRWGMIYRSGVLSGLTAQDLTYLSQLGVKEVFDFRVGDETQAAPEKWISGPGVKLISVPVGTDAKSPHPTVDASAFFATNPTPEQVHKWFMGVYATMAISGAPSYAATLRGMIDGPLPAMYHCTAGKDRTGVFSAILLKILGVPQDTIDADYHLTETYLDDAGRAKMNAAANNPKMMAGIPAGSMKAAMAASPEILRSAFDAMDQKYGSFDNYRRQALKLSDADVATLKSKLLTQ
jgi:protein-tyrosine phosphatase